MAYNFTSASSQFLSSETTIFKSQNKITLAAWVYRNAAGTAQIVGPNKNAIHRIGFYSYTDNNLYFFIMNGSQPFGRTPAPAAAAWAHICMVFDGTQASNATRLLGYVQGAQRTLTFSGTIPSSSSSNVDVENFTINRAQFLPLFGNGQYAEVGVWHEPLTAAEIASLAKGMTCDKIRPQNLVFYAPLVRDLVDVKGGLTITNNNGATVANHPRVYA
jgi:hypothetical protein